MIVCERCGKRNEDHYKFCLGCGAELLKAGAPKESYRPPKSVPAAPATNPSQTPKEEGSNITGADAPSEVTSAADASADTTGAKKAKPDDSAGENANRSVDAGGEKPGGQKSCSSCGADIPEGFRFCGACGTPVAPTASVPEEKGKAQSSPEASGSSRAALISIQPDGSEGVRIEFDGSYTVGRGSDRQFESDPHLSMEHATFEFRGDHLYLRDLESLNGVFMRLPAEKPVTLEDGSIFRIGQEIIQFETMLAARKGNDSVLQGADSSSFVGRIKLVVGPGRFGNIYPVKESGTHLGRESGDIVFPEDGYVSGLHCRLYSEGGQVNLVDIGSSNGTFIRVQEEKVPPGTFVLMGQQLFKVSY